MPWVGLWCVIVVFPGHTHVHFEYNRITKTKKTRSSGFMTYLGQTIENLLLLYGDNKVVDTLPAYSIITCCLLISVAKHVDLIVSRSNSEYSIKDSSLWSNWSFKGVSLLPLLLIFYFRLD